MPSLRMNSFSYGVQLPRSNASLICAASASLYSPGVIKSQRTRPASWSALVYPVSRSSSSLQSRNLPNLSGIPIPIKSDSNSLRKRDSLTRSAFSVTFCSVTFRK